MARRINLSQLKSQLRQLEAEQRQAISRYNQGVRKYNDGVRNLRRAIDPYNQEVRSYNSRQRLNRQRLQSELRRLRSQRSTRYSALGTSVSRLQAVYTRLEESAATQALSPAQNYFLDLAEQEAANSAEVVNALLEPEVSEEAANLQQTAIIDEIAVISEDLESRWPGALFAALPEAQGTERGNATRRSKIAFLLLQKGAELEELAEFANEDIANVLELFDVLNSGTHGQAGTYDIATLAAIKRRVEDELRFLSRMAA